MSGYVTFVDKSHPGSKDLIEVLTRAGRVNAGDILPVSKEAMECLREGLFSIEVPEHK